MDSIFFSAPHPGQAVRLLDTVLDWMDRARERRALARLDDRLLADLGLGRAEAWAEADKPFWRK
jgi:Uncharacterized conserved small protein